MLAALSVVAVVCFLAVTGLSRVYHAQQESLGQRWFTRGIADLNARRYSGAVNDFRTALLYSRDDFNYQLNLAEALIGLKRTSEAEAYFINLWDRQPENGFVNLELARIAAQRGETEKTLRYYHNAIYAAWTGDEAVERREARFELIDFLLRINARTQAQSELIALVANLGNDPSQLTHVGDLFVRAQDYENALAAYRSSLKADHHNPAATAGAGLAAFQLGRYSLAERYLAAAVSGNPNDTQSSARLKTTELVLRMDPFQRQTSVAQGIRIVMENFAVGGDRLKFCSSANATTSQQSLSESWGKMKSHITQLGLRRDPDLVEKAMELVFGIERETSATCGVPPDKDAALLLIAKLHEGN